MRQQLTVALGRCLKEVAMVTFCYGGKAGAPHSLEESDAFLAVRTFSRASVVAPAAFETAPVSREARAALGEMEPVLQLPEAGVEVFQARPERPARDVRDRARAVLKEEPAIRFAGRVLVDPRGQRPVLYTENLFVKFQRDLKVAACREILARYELTIKRRLAYARNAFFVAAPEDTGQAVFEIAQRLLQEEAVEYSHPELVREARSRGAFPQQWHLKRTTFGGKAINAHASVEVAWALSDGTGTVIAVIDTGIDIDHEEFRGAGKIVAPRDATLGTEDPRPRNRENHGTGCAGVACGGGQFGASGVAPGARLMPIRLQSGLGSQQEADAFAWAADHGADVISCSWGPADGDWWDPSDPVHNQVVPLPDSTRLAMDYAIRTGRNGKGCVILFAAGNGNESVANDGYASHNQVIAVAACNDTGKRSAYSDFGPAVWCAFPSNDGEPALTPGIWTTDRMGALGYNPGRESAGDTAGNYTNAFGGTSSACPGAAGVAALVLARNPDLRWDEVRDVLKRCCDRIDEEGGNFDADGHSPFYGYGRLNAKKAVDLASPSQPTPIVTRSIRQDVAIRDFKTARLRLPVADEKALKSIKVTVEIDHTYIGDLVVTVLPPEKMGVAPIVLHNREGRETDNLRTSYDAVNIPALAGCVGKKPSGMWTLEVADKAAQDVGKVRAFTLELGL
jgi:subtilisin family serine protease